MYRKYSIDDKLFTTSYKVIEKVLRDNNYATRDAIREELKKKNIEGDSVYISCIMMQAELTGLICSGPRQGNQDKRPARSRSEPCPRAGQHGWRCWTVVLEGMAVRCVSCDAL